MKEMFSSIIRLDTWHEINSFSRLCYMSEWPTRIQKLQNFIFYDIAGPRCLCFRYQLDVFKGATFIWVLLLMNYFHNYSSGMYLYLFLHGTYGICWVVKDVWFPDERVLHKASIGSNLVLFGLLVSYWMIPVPLAAGYGLDEPSIARVIFLVVLYVVGVFLMMGADYQKTTTLRKRKGLISNGFFKLSRNPNYLGEIFIYSSFVLCANNIVSILIFYTLGGVLFTMNIYLKQVMSYHKKEGWKQYSQQSYVLLPKLFPTGLLNLAFYAVVFISIFYFLMQEVPQGFWYPLTELTDFMNKS